MKDYAKLKHFPLGAVTAKGFLLEQLERAKDGMTGYLWELEPQMIDEPYLKRTYVKAWGDGDQDGWSAEISGNYWTGYIQAAFVKNDAEMIDRVTKRIDLMLKRQREDGYLGTFNYQGAYIYDDFNGWGTGAMLRGLLAFYEATGRKDVLEAIHRCLVWFTIHWAGDKKGVYAGQLLIELMVQVYKLTDDERLLAFAEDYADFMCEHDVFYCSYQSMLERKYAYNTNHTVAEGLALRLPALLYSVTGKEKYLRAAEKRTHEVWEHSTQLTGGPISQTEYLAPVSSLGETEYCSFALFNASYAHLEAVTGKAEYAQAREVMFYNGAQGGRKKDEKAIAYFTAPNQIFATEKSSTDMWDMQVYSPCYPTSCCPVNSVVALPEYIRHMMLLGENALYVSCYGPCRVDHGDMAVEMKTMYPFRNHVRLCVERDGEYEMHLRIPTWAVETVVKVNGVAVEVVKGESGYACAGKSWKAGDVVEIDFAARVEVIHVDDRDAANKRPIAFRYGALVFSLPIPEKWVPIKGSPMTALPAGWSWWDVQPDYREPDVEESHARIGLRRSIFPWNYAVDENITAEDVEVVECGEEGYVWETPRVKLRVSAWFAPLLSAPYAARTFEPFGQKQVVTDQRTIELVPYGCTALRITYFPRADV